MAARRKVQEPSGCWNVFYDLFSHDEAARCSFWAAVSWAIPKRADWCRKMMED